jgi:hypothetical protein
MMGYFYLNVLGVNLRILQNVLGVKNEGNDTFYLQSYNCPKSHEVENEMEQWEEDDMAYDEVLAERVSAALGDMPQLEAKKMFGGVGYLVSGNMAVGVHKDKLIVRVGHEGFEEKMSMPHTVPFDITGKAMKGWLMVVQQGVESEDDLKYWIDQGVDFAQSLPPK